MPLIIAPINKILKVVKILTDKNLKNHLEGLGIKIDTSISVISKNDNSIICFINDTKLVLDNEIAQKIFVA